MQRFETLDWIVIGIYFLLIAALAIWVMTRKQKTTEDYFLAGRNLGWFVVGASIFASNIGSEHVVGLAGAGAGGKIPMLIYELHAWLVITLGWVFLPFYMRSGVFTTPEFLERRFNANTRWFLSVFSLVAYVLTKVSVTVYAGGAHHTCYSQNLSPEHLEDFAEMAGIEYVRITKGTDLHDFKNMLRWNEMYYR